MSHSDYKWTKMSLFIVISLYIKNNKVLSLVSGNWDSLARILIYNKINNTIYINSNKIEL